MPSATQPNPYRIVQAPLDVEIEPITSALSPVEWTHADRTGAAHGFVLVSGSGTVRLGEAESALAAPCVIWLPAGKAGRVRLAAGVRGSAIKVSESALGRAVPAGPSAAPLRQSLELPLLGANIDARRAGTLMAAMDAIAGEAERAEPASREAIMSHLTLILITLWRIGNPSPGDAQVSPRVLVQNFLQLVELHLRDHWTVARYAQALGISADRLNTAVHRATGLTPLALIHRRLVENAEALLERSTMQVGEIADALGFRDAAYFNRFFTRVVGLPPGRFRARSQRQRLTPDGSFAAWP